MLHPSYRQNTTEVNVSYIIKQFDARVMSFYKDTRFNACTEITGRRASACSSRSPRRFAVKTKEEAMKHRKMLVD